VHNFKDHSVSLTFSYAIIEAVFSVNSSYYWGSHCSPTKSHALGLFRQSDETQILQIFKWRHCPDHSARLRGIEVWKYLFL